MNSSALRESWQALDQDSRDAAYDNNSAVSDSASIIEERNSSSAEFRKARPEHLNLPYGPRERNRWDLFPGSNPEAPCLVFIHGGYWIRNGPENFSVFAQGLLQHGWSVALPGYTLAPEATLSTITSEITAALDWLAINGPLHGINGKTILSGWSAGAQLATVALSHESVNAGLAISGIYDLEPLRQTNLNDKLRLTRQEAHELSPIARRPSLKPLTIAYGGDELPAIIRNAEKLHAHRKQVLAPGSLVPVLRTNHFTILDELRVPDSPLIKAALSLAGESAPHTGPVCTSVHGPCPRALRGHCHQS